jgi:hypothetical protein
MDGRKMPKRRILLLWPTVRPQIMKTTYQHWIDTSSKENKIDVKIAVNDVAQRNELSDFMDVMVVGNKRGPTWATYNLTQSIKCEDNPIIIVVSDDFFSPLDWDKSLIGIFDDWNGSVVVNDGFKSTGVMTIPIMTYDCLLKLNKIIYHHAYHWQYSDVELYYNLHELNLIKMAYHLTFNHRHYSHGFRTQDEHDVFGNNMSSIDAKTFKTRMQMPIGERLK